MRSFLKPAFYPLASRDRQDWLPNDGKRQSVNTEKKTQITQWQSGVTNIWLVGITCAKKTLKRRFWSKGSGSSRWVCHDSPGFLSAFAKTTTPSYYAVTVCKATMSLMISWWLKFAALIFSLQITFGSYVLIHVLATWKKWSSWNNGIITDAFS